ncbi:MAG: hypothetical protein HYU58_19590 [Proteobacteria bacterium]|nr:hypothetical protein [Pseudomonadota bacterium]
MDQVVAALTEAFGWIKANWAALGLGTASAALFTHWINRRANRLQTFDYTVHHERVGVTDNSGFGDIKVTFNANIVPNLYVTTVTLTNTTSKDQSGVTFRINANASTIMMTQLVGIKGTSYVFPFSDEYQKQLTFANGKPSQQQVNLYGALREFTISTFVKGSVAEVRLLTNVPSNNGGPVVTVDMMRAGTKVRYVGLGPQMMGIPLRTARIVGLIMVIALYILSAAISGAWLSSLFCIFVGLAVAPIGALAYRFWRGFLAALPGY